MELELVMEQMSLLETGLVEYLSRAENGMPPPDPTEHQVLITSLQHILATGVEHLEAWLSVAGVAPEDEASGSYAPLSFLVQSRPVSLHIPLHRFVAFFASQLCHHIGTDALHSIFPSRSTVLSFLEHPLRIQVLLAQIRGGLWRWNGETMLRRAWFYRSSYFYDFGFDLDLFLLQTAAVLLDPDSFLITLLHRFAAPSPLPGPRTPRWAALATPTRAPENQRPNHSRPPPILPRVRHVFRSHDIAPLSGSTWCRFVGSGPQRIQSRTATRTRTGGPGCRTSTCRQ